MDRPRTASWCVERPFHPAASPARRAGTAPFTQPVVADRARTVKRLQKILEQANLKLAAVVSDVMGRSARARLEAMIAGQGDPQTLAELAPGRLREKMDRLEQALQGRVRDVHRFMLAAALAQIDYYDEHPPFIGNAMALWVLDKLPLAVFAGVLGFPIVSRVGAKQEDQPARREQVLRTYRNGRVCGAWDASSECAAQAC